MARAVRFIKAFGLASTLILWMSWFSEGTGASERPTAPSSRLRLDDSDLLLYLEAVTQIMDKAVFVDEMESRRTIIQDTLKAYLADRDDSSQYLSREEFGRFRDSQKDGYIGIGLEISRDPGGEVVCFPSPLGPAEKGGIKTGDRLVAVDGDSIRGQSLAQIAARVRGSYGSAVELTVRTGSSPERRVHLRRERNSAESVSVSQMEGMTVVKLAYFTNDMQAKVSGRLADWKAGTPLILDLRGNGGGDFYAALDTAALFLSRGQMLARVRGRKGEQSFAARAPRRYRFHRVYLWQDQYTASAAEVFVAALTDNGIGVSIGTRSLGKGTKQDIVELSDGSALILTTGFLLTPTGKAYHDIGLLPALALENPTTTDYVARVREALSQEPRAALPEVPEK